MKQKYKITSEQAKEIRSKIKGYEKTSAFRKLQAIMLLGEGESIEAVSQTTFYHPTYVYELVKKFCVHGFEQFTKDGRGGAHRMNLTKEQEEQILDKFKEKAIKGQVVSLGDVKREYERVRGKETANSTFYNFLDRMDWRRVMPRGAHPKKASDEAIQASKKLTFS